MNAKSYSPLDLARANAQSTGSLMKWAALPPLPLIACGAALMQVFSPGMPATEFQEAVAPWYRDPFLLAIFAVYAFGQFAALSQLRTLSRGLRKVKAVLGVLSQAGGAAPLQDLQARLSALDAPGHLSDLLQRWLRLGLAGDVAPINVLMERAAYRRARSVEKKVSIHATLNRTMLKLGFLGTLLGLIVTFPPMKAAILTLDPKNLEKGASFVKHIAGAIDGDQYAILTTMVATGFSLFIELMTVQILRTLCARFEAVNGGVDEWCLTELQPQVRRETAAREDMGGLVARRLAFQQQLLSLELQFQEAWHKLQAESEGRFILAHTESERRMLEAMRKAEDRLTGFQEESLRRLGAVLETHSKQLTVAQAELGRNLETVGRYVHAVSEKLNDTLPLQQGYGRRLDELLAYERQYRSFLEARERITVPRHLEPEIN